MEKRLCEDKKLLNEKGVLTEKGQEHQANHSLAITMVNELLVMLTRTE